MNSNNGIFVTLFFILISFSPFSAQAFSPETHVWVAQEVLNDARDGMIDINGTLYPIDPVLRSALQSHPEAFLAGNIGPDAFPDPVVGQMTTHPGIEGGWQTDQFLKHVLRNANTPEELAFAYGFIGHAATDIFSHTYINRYAGDIFLLTDGEETVELRHFLLEKYIGQKTPSIPRDRDSYSIPASFIRDTFIFNGDIDSQNKKASGTASHLVASYAVRKAIGNLENELVRARNVISDKVADYLDFQTKLSLGLPQLKLEVEIARQAVNVAKAGFEIEDKAYQETLNALKTAKDTLERNREIISLNERLISEQARILSDSAGAVAGLRTKVSETQAAVDQIATELANTPAKMSKRICEELSKIPIFGPIIKETVCKVVDVTSDAWIAVNTKLSEARGALNQAQADLDRYIALAAQATADKARIEADNLAKAKENLALDAATKSLEAAVALKNADALLKKNTLDSAQKALNVAKESLAHLENEISKTHALWQQFTDALVRLDPITLFVGNWRRDIDRAMEEYVKIGLEVGVSTVRREGASLSLYIDWWNCWAPVFQGIPSAVPQVVCAVKDAYQDSVHWLLDRLGDAAWLLVPDMKANEIIHNEIEKALPTAVAEMVKFTTGKSDLARMLELIGTKGVVSDNELASVFSRDDSSKGLLLIPDVTERIRQDLALHSDNTFDSSAFHPAKNAITLTKLALLNIEQLNAVYRHYLKSESSTYGGDLYKKIDEGRFSILFDAVRSIDGNHQWQEFALPYPRQRNIKNDWYLSVKCEKQDKGCYGYPKEPGNKGFRFWVDKDARDFFFKNIFTGPQSPGLDTHRYLSADFYPFPECKDNPFPKASENGNILRQDLNCSNWLNRLSEALKWFNKPGHF